MPTPFVPAQPSLSEPGPGQILVAVTPSDTVNLVNGVCRAIHVNGAGNVKFSDARGNAVTVTLVAGMPIPYAASRIWSTGTTATGIFAVY